MDNVSNNSPHHVENRTEPVPVARGAEETRRPAENAAAGSPGVSRAPLNLGGGVNTPAAPVAPKAPVLNKPLPPKPAAPVGVGIATGGRITACKTFFTKLHPGAMHFLDEQIAKWLTENPSIVVKLVNVIQGEITEKKIEPNIVIVVWY
jgi:hypothetical protein